MNLLYWLRRFGAFPVLTPLPPEGGFYREWLKTLPTPAGRVWVFTDTGQRTLKVPPLKLTGEGLAMRATAALVHEVALRHGEYPVPIGRSHKKQAWLVRGLVVVFSASRLPPIVDLQHPQVVFSQREPKGKGMLTWVPLKPGGYQHLAEVLDAHLQGH